MGNTDKKLKMALAIPKKNLVKAENPLSAQRNSTSTVAAILPIGRKATILANNVIGSGGGGNASVINGQNTNTTTTTAARTDASSGGGTGTGTGTGSGTGTGVSNATTNAETAVEQPPVAVSFVQGHQPSRFSRKVFVGGLPPDIDEYALFLAFRKYGALRIDWPHKESHPGRYPPKGFAFIIFRDEHSVNHLLRTCLVEDDKYFLYLSSRSITKKPVQIRPWRMSDAECVLDPLADRDQHKTIFIGGVPRTLKAFELAVIMNRLYDGVCYAAIDTDPQMKYPKGTARVTFSTSDSYVKALAQRFMQVQHGDADKRVEVRPFIMKKQPCHQNMSQSPCGNIGPLFCPSLNCLKYYCAACWRVAHIMPGHEQHKPMKKDRNEPPRSWPLSW